ncbi:hypothetical protein [Rossellomorea marisflavi]|uniref:hypothetical protein n=1 Tax=Rossellomorea marisflavi TaxID=189381 RepID=UPI003D2F1039
MDLKQVNSEYERIIHSSRDNETKDKMLANLMTAMEAEYNIPMTRNPEWEEQNRKVIALYRKISNSRTFE